MPSIMDFRSKIPAPRVNVWTRLARVGACVGLGVALTLVILSSRADAQTGERPAATAVAQATAQAQASAQASAQAPAPSPAAEPVDGFERSEGGIVRGPRTAKRIALVFTGHEFAEGGDIIADALRARGARASFFLTGVFLRNPAHAPLLRHLVRDGHFIGPHSDQHLLLCPWDGPKRSLVSREQFDEDVRANLRALAPHGVDPARVTFFLPSYEWYNADHAAWSRALGLTLINFTRGTRSNADYTEEGTKQFVSSETIFRSILDREARDPDGLNGFLLLLHVGAGPKRSDKMAARFAPLLDALIARGYTFVRVDELLAPGAAAPPASAPRAASPPR